MKLTDECIEDLEPRPGLDRLLDAHTERSDSSGVYKCKSVVNYFKHGNFIRKSEVNHLTYEDCIEIPVEFTYVNQ